MRGADEQPGSMFSYISPEERVPADHPLRAVRRITDRALERLSPRFGTLYVNFGRPSIRAGEAAPRLAAASDLHHPQRAAVDGATGLQHPVSLVRGPGHGRRRVVGHDLHEESRSLARRRHRPRLLRGRADPCRHRATCCRTSISPSMARCSKRGRVTRAFGRADEDEPPSTGRRRQSDRRFSRPTPHERHPPVAHRPRCAALQEGARPRGAPGLLGPCPDGASLGADRQRHRHAGRRPWRTRRRAGDDRGRARASPHHRRGRQGV